MDIITDTHRPAATDGTGILWVTSSSNDAIFLNANDSKLYFADCTAFVQGKYYAINGGYDQRNQIVSFSNTNALLNSSGTSTPLRYIGSVVMSRSLSTPPTRPGIYICNGQKVVVK